MCYFVSFIALQSSRWEERTNCVALFVFLLSRDYSVALPHDIMGLQFVIVVFSDQTHLLF